MERYRGRCLRTVPQPWHQLVPTRLRSVARRTVCLTPDLEMVVYGARRPGLLSRLVVLHRQCGVATGILEGDEVADLGDRELLHQNPTSCCDHSLSGDVDIVDSERAFEPTGGPVVEKLATWLDGSHRGVPGLVQNLHEAGRPVVSELPAEHRGVERFGGRDVVGVDREMGQL